MARRLALLPEELISSYQLQKPEFRLETQIESLLESGKLPDDMKAKLLSQLITRYQKTVHTPQDPVRVTIEPSNQDLQNMSQTITQEKKESEDLVYRSILASTTSSFVKFIPMIIEKLKLKGYSWNDNGELTYAEKPFQGSSISDFFFFLSRNGKMLSQPYGFEKFLKALKISNIPISWIANKKVQSDMQKLDLLGLPQGEVFEIKEEKPTLQKHKSYDNLYLESSQKTEPQWQQREWLEL